MQHGAIPEWSEVIADALNARLDELHTAMPGQISAVYLDDASRGQLVDVQPCLRHAVATADEPDASRPWVEEELPTLQRVPVAFPQGGGYAISWPLQVGDFVTLVFAERSLRHWLATARKASRATSPTEDVEPHTLDGAVALPLGPAPLGELLTNIDLEGISIGSQLNNARGRVIIRHDAIVIGIPNSEAEPSESLAAVAREDKVYTQLGRIADDLSRLVAATSTAIGAVPGGGEAKTAFDLAVGATAPPATKVPSSPSHVGSEHVLVL